MVVDLLDCTRLVHASISLGITLIFISPVWQREGKEREGDTVVLFQLCYMSPTFNLNCTLTYSLTINGIILEVAETGQNRIQLALDITVVFGTTFT